MVGGLIHSTAPSPVWSVLERCTVSLPEPSSSMVRSSQRRAAASPRRNSPSRITHRSAVSRMAIRPRGTLDGSASNSTQVADPGEPVGSQPGRLQPKNWLQSPGDPGDRGHRHHADPEPDQTEPFSPASVWRLAPLPMSGRTLTPSRSPSPRTPEPVTREGSARPSSRCCRLTQSVA